MKARINPTYIKGEPECSGEKCDQYRDDFPHWWVCLVSNTAITEGLLCIPALKRDRDKVIEENKHFKTLIDRCIDGGCNCHDSIYEDNPPPEDRLCPACLAVKLRGHKDDN